MIRKAKNKGARMFITKTIPHSVRPSHRRPITKWVGMVISEALLWLVPIAFLSKVILHGATGGPEPAADAMKDPSMATSPQCFPSLSVSHGPSTR
jgi:hypothetical protein